MNASESKSRGEGESKLPDIQEHTALGTLTKEAASESNQISIPKIELPKGGGAIRGIDEKFKVNAANGTASLSVPFPITPGRHGFSPSLSLSYSSGGGNTPFGLGWSLSLAQISRKTDKGIPQYAGEDVFVMAGAEDLVPYLVEDGPGNWVPEVRSEGDYRISRYRPRISSDHARIEMIHHPDHGTYWRVTSAQNTVVIYGRSAAYRVADPEDARKIFTWLPEFSYDDKGNWMRYQYKAEDLDQVAHTLQESHRHDGRQAYANRYLKSVLYGNAQPYSPDPDKLYDPSEPTDATCHYELVLDYGEHDKDTPTPAEINPWPVREDPFSSYRAGFEIRTYRLCRRVLMFHHFPDEKNQDGTEFGNDYLVRSLELSYIPSSINGSGQAEVSYLAEVTASGYVRKGDGSYSKKSLPPLSMNYRHLEWNKHIQQLSQTELDNLPEGLGGSYQWVDLYGEGINGLLTEQGNGWFYKDNLGDLNDEGSLTFGSTQPVIPKPSFSGLGIQITIADLDADGLKEIIVQNGGIQGYYGMGSDGHWKPFESVNQVVNLNMSDPNVRVFDITGDGKPDLVMTEERVITYYESKGKEGYAEHNRAVKALDEAKGPAVVFADDHNKVLLADMSGDGLTDIIRVRNNEVCYWPNMGYGKFGAKVSMGNVPNFDLPDRFNAAQVYLADISGTGTTDIIYLGDGHFKAYINQGGNSLSDVQFIEPFFPLDSMVNLQAVDLLGTGTTCLVWSSTLPADRSHPLRYIDLMGSQKPHVLLSYQNNMGLSTSLDYRSSTHFYLKDKIAGTLWITKLPFPVQVVEKTTLEDAITNVRFSTRYTYHHGFYDHQEREFRGFGMVEQVDSEHYTAWKDENQDSSLEQSEETFQPPVLTRTWYHTGAFLRKDKVLSHFKTEYWHARYEARYPGELGTIVEPELPDAIKEAAAHLQDVNAINKLSGEEHREAARACKGMVLRSETFELKAEDPENPTDEELRRQMRPYQVATHNCRIILQQPRTTNPYGCFQVLESEAFQVSYEQDITDPRINHKINLQTDRYGNVLQAVTIAYARFSPDTSLPQVVRYDQAKTHITLSRSTYTHDATREIDSAFGDSYRLRMLCESETYELRNISKSGTFYQPSDFTDVLETATSEIPYLQSHSNAPERRKIEHSKTLFLKDDLSGPLNPGELQPRGLTYESYALAYTPDMLTALFPAGFLPAADYPATDAQYVHFEGDAHWWVPSGRAIYMKPGETLADVQNRFWNPIGYRDAGGSEVRVTFYKDYYFLIQSVTDAVGNTTNADAFNFRTLSPVVQRDANDTLAASLLDELGMVKATAILGKDLDGDEIPEVQLADNLSVLHEWTDDEDAAVQNFFQQTDPVQIDTEAVNLLKQASSRFVYDLDAWKTRQKPVVACGIMRETHHAELNTGEKSQLQIAFEYTDGMGNLAMTKVKAEPGPAMQTTVNDDGSYVVSEADTTPAIRWLGNGRTVLNNKGKMVKQYQPYFSVSPAYESAPELVESGHTFIFYYDSLGRHTRTLFPDKTLQEIHFDAWKKEVWDQNDMSLQSEWYQKRFNRQIDAELVEKGKDPEKEQVAAAKTAAHDSTPSLVHLDTLGRPVMTVAHNKQLDNTDEFIRTSISLDIEGNSLSVTDARGNTVMAYRYNMLGGRVYTNSMDAGERWHFANALGKPVRTRDSRNHTTTINYDALHRITEKRISGRDGSGSLDHTFSRIVYGENQPDDKANGLRGMPFQVHDSSGRMTNTRYDIKGQPAEMQKQLLKDAKAEIIDWDSASAANLLSDETFTKIIEYDALGRMSREYNWHRDPASVTVYEPVYNARGMLQSEDHITGASRNGDTYNGGRRITAVSGFRYSEKGQRIRMQLGNGTLTRYHYDPVTFRLVQMRTTRQPNGALPSAPSGLSDPNVLQNLYYTYDAVGNITEIHDDAYEPVFFNNQVVEPRSRYTYDALYRLIRAEGRENDNFNHAPPAPGHDALRHNFPLTDRALRNYLQTYNYDEVGNIQEMRHFTPNERWTRQYTYADDSNRLITTFTGGNPTSAITYRYDAHGNMLNYRNTLEDLTRDYRDMMQHLDLEGGGDAWYQYDEGRQRSRKLIERNDGTREERLYLGGMELYRRWRGDSLLEEIETHHLFVDDQRVLLVENILSTDNNNLSTGILDRYQYSNHLGSVGLELDGNADIISYEEYHPYGTVAYRANNSNINTTAKRYRYTGMERDEESGLNYHSARYYLPWLGRWFSADPIGIKDGVNVYRYSRNNPIILRDRKGMQSEDPASYVSDDYDRHARGDIGEWNLQQHFDDSDRYEPVGLDASKRGSRSGGGGFDLLVYDKDTGKVLIIDNKAYQSNIGKVSALEENFGKNLGSALEKLKASGIEIDNAAYEALKEGKYDKVVSNAFSKGNVGFTEGLFQKGIKAFDIRTGKIYSKYADYAADAAKIAQRAAEAGEKLKKSRIVKKIGKADGLLLKIGKAAGKAGAKAAPGVGIGIGLYSAYDNFEQGKYLRGVIDMGGMIPGPIGAAIDGVGLIYDVGEILIDEITESDLPDEKENEGKEEQEEKEKPKPIEKPSPIPIPTPMPVPKKEEPFLCS